MLGHILENAFQNKDKMVCFTLYKIKVTWLCLLLFPDY